MRRASTKNVGKIVVETYSDYIEKYLLCEHTPGEHHFVAAYLLPRVLKICGVMPDYINPDGMKSVIGDITWFRGNKHHFAIEVKFGTIRLTKNEFNNWIVCKDSDNHPDVFIGIGKKGLILLSWSDFIAAYKSSTNLIEPCPIESGYGPQKFVDVLYGELDKGTFGLGNSLQQCNILEKSFIKSLTDILSDMA